MADPPPPNQGPPGTPGPQGQPQRTNGDPPSQQVTQPIHYGQPYNFAVSPGAQFTFAPALPPNTMMVPRSPAMIPPNSPAMMPSNHPTMMSPVPPPRHFFRGSVSLQQQQQQAYEQRLLSLSPQQRTQFHRYAQARRLQQQALLQSSPPSQQERHQFVSSQNFRFTQEPNFQMNQPSNLRQARPNAHFNLPPNVGRPIPAFHPVNLGQSASNPPPNYPVNRGQPILPQAGQSAFEAFARQVVHDMNTQSAEEFIHGRRPQAPVLVGNRPVFQHPQQQAPHRPISHHPVPQQQYSPQLSRPSSPILYHPQPRPVIFQRALPGASFTPCPAKPSQHQRWRSSKGSKLVMEMGDPSTSDGRMAAANSSTNFGPLGSSPEQKGNLLRDQASEDSGYNTREQSNSIPPAHDTTAVDAETTKLDEQRQSAAVLHEPFGTVLPALGMATQTLHAAATHLAQSTPQPLQQGPAGDNEDFSSATLADIDPSYQAVDVVDGFLIDDEPEGWGNTNVDDLVGVLDSYLNVEEEAKEFVFPQAATGQFSAEKIRKSVPFM
jgi:hypothetical protein